MTIILIAIIAILTSALSWAWSINNDLEASLRDLDQRLQDWESYYNGDDDEPEGAPDPCRCCGIYDAEPTHVKCMPCLQGIVCSEDCLDDATPYSNLMALRVEVA